jgi:hypothetical protein
MYQSLSFPPDGPCTAKLIAAESGDVDPDSIKIVQIGHNKFDTSANAKAGTFRVLYPDDRK